MANTLSAIAVARSLAMTRLMMAALIGPVDRNKHSCAVTMHACTWCVEVVVSANQTKGCRDQAWRAADSHRYACREFLAK